MILRLQRNLMGMFRFVFCALIILVISVTLSSLLSCRVTVEGEPHGPGGRPAHLSGIEGLWFINANNFTGRLEFYWTRNRSAGRLRFDTGSRWIEVTDILLDSHTGQLQFTAENQIYSGTLSGNRIVGTFFTPGLGNYPWEAWR